MSTLFIKNNTGSVYYVPSLGIKLDIDEIREIGKDFKQKDIFKNSRLKTLVQDGDLAVVTEDNEILSASEGEQYIQYVSMADFCDSSQNNLFYLSPKYSGAIILDADVKDKVVVYANAEFGNNNFNHYKHSRNHSSANTIKIKIQKQMPENWKSWQDPAWTIKYKTTGSALFSAWSIYRNDDLVIQKGEIASSGNWSTCDISYDEINTLSWSVNDLFTMIIESTVTNIGEVVEFAILKGFYI